MHIQLSRYSVPTAVVLLLLAALLVISPGSAAAQSAASGSVGGRDQPRLRTIDELYLEGAISVRALSAQLRSSDSEHQILALAAIEDQLQTGLLAPDDEELFRALAVVLEEGVHHVAYSSSTMPFNYHPTVRYRAAQVMGLVGTEDARKQLVYTVAIDPDPAVRAQALYSLGAIGQDPDGSVTRTIARMMRREHVGDADPGAIYAALVAIERISSNPANVVDSSAVSMVVTVATGKPYNRLVRSKAMQVLAVL